jgi:hypothetical protein
MQRRIWHLDYFEIGSTQPPGQRYQNGLSLIRSVDMAKVMESFMQSVNRTVNKTFADVQPDKLF